MEIIDGAFDVLIEPITRYEGTLARLAGDGILAFFGAPIAHEDDAERACRAALEILEGAGERTIPALLIALCLAASGLVSTQAAAFGMRYLHWRRRLGPARYVLALLWVLIVSAFWWGGAYLLLFVAGVLPAAGVLTQAWLNVSLAVVIHYLSYGIRRLVAPRIRLDWLPSRSKTGFRAHPKALSIRDAADTAEIVDGLDSLRAAYGRSSDQGERNR